LRQRPGRGNGTSEIDQENSMAVTKTLKALAARATMGDADVRALLTKDHVEALDLAKRMSEAKGAAARKAILKKLKPALAAHSRAEEQAVYNPLLKVRSKDSNDIGNEGYVEHSLLDELLARLSRGAGASDKWKAEAKVLYEILDHHVSEEQSEMYADLGERFSAEELEQMGLRFTRLKQKYLKR
jgi:hypothetical protein